MEFTREELWKLQERAEKGMDSVLNENWKRAYADLIHATSTLDAFIARSTVPENTFTVTTESPITASV
jgi:hypothetical protein